MASRLSRTLHPVSRSWSFALSGISRNFGELCNSVKSRSYCDETPAAKSGDAVTDSKDDQVADPSSVSELPAVSPVPQDTTNSGTEKPSFPPRNYRTPRGVYKVILLGEVGQLPVQKILKSGRSVTIFSVGTGGMYNNRRPFEGETPEEYADRSYTQWHRVAVYQDRVAGLVMQHMKVGSQVYLEGNIESRVYNDPNSGIVKRIREVAIRANGRLMFMEASTGSLKSETRAQSAAEQREISLSQLSERL